MSIDYSTTDLITDELIDQINEDLKDNQPKKPEELPFTCGTCRKFSRTTPNPFSQMGRCAVVGVMKLHTDSCQHYAERKNSWPI